MDERWGRTLIVRLLLTLIYAAVGLYLAFPLSYWFQSDIYGEMTWAEYFAGDRMSLLIGAQFGAIDTYRNTVVGCVIGAIIVGRGLEWIVRQRKKPLKK